MCRNGYRGARSFVARIVVAGLLLGALLATNLPLATLAQAPACTLACCAGMPSHAAGSCMGGSCHSGLLVHQHRTRRAPEAEPICGIPQAITSKSVIPTVYAEDSALTTGQSTQPQVSSAVMAKPCQPDCGAGASGSINLNRQRDKVLLRMSALLKPHTSFVLASAVGSNHRIVDPMVWSGTPRGPPNSFC